MPSIIDVYSTSWCRSHNWRLDSKSHFYVFFIFVMYYFLNRQWLIFVFKAITNESTPVWLYLIFWIFKWLPHNLRSWDQRWKIRNVLFQKTPPSIQTVDSTWVWISWVLLFPQHIAAAVLCMQNHLESFLCGLIERFGQRGLPHKESSSFQLTWVNYI